MRDGTDTHQRASLRVRRQRSRRCFCRRRDAVAVVLAVVETLASEPMNALPMLS